MDACLVAADVPSTPYIGVVRRERYVWRIMLFGVPGDQQPREAFATRAEAAERLIELVDAGDGSGSVSR